MNELRKDLLLDRFVIIAKNRGKRPSDFAQKEKKEEKRLCCFCPGNEHLTPPEISRKESGGRWVVRCFPNKFPAVSLNFRKAYGTHEVIVETEEHGKSLSELPLERVMDVIDMYEERIRKLRENGKIRYVLIFKNEGEEAGASLTHSHTQLISLSRIPKLIREELNAQKRYFKKNKKCFFCNISEIERERIIFKNEHIICFAPYASRFPFEVWLTPVRHVGCLSELRTEEKGSLALMLKNLLMKLDKLLNKPPYNYFLHISPSIQTKYFHFHIELCPRISKWAGFEFGTDIIINTLPPEDAAQFLKDIAQRI